MLGSIFPSCTYFTICCVDWRWWMEFKKQQIIHFSWKEKIGNKRSCPESQRKLRGERSYLDSFRCPAYQDVRGSVAMKLKFLKWDQQLEWNPALRNRIWIWKIWRFPSYLTESPPSTWGYFCLLNTKWNSIQCTQFCQATQTKLRLFLWDHRSSL